MVWPGAQIAWLGGTWYYLLAGLALVAAAVLAWIGRHRCSLGLVAAVFAATLVWSLVEIGGKGRMAAWGFDFLARNGIVALMFALTAVAFAFRTTPRGSRARRQVLSLFVVAVGGWPLWPRSSGSGPRPRPALSFGRRRSAWLDRGPPLSGRPTGSSPVSVAGPPRKARD